MKFGERLKNARGDRFLSKAKLAEILNTSRQMILKYESGESYPTIDLLVRMADYFELSADELLGRDEYVGASKSKGQKCIVLPSELTDEDADFVRDVVSTLRRRRTGNVN